jgi:nucleoid DNA-binding protein
MQKPSLSSDEHRSQYMNKNQMVVDIAKEMGLPQLEVKAAVQKVLDGIIDVLDTEGRLELRNFGVFEVVTRKARVGRNPKTGETAEVPERKTVKFKPGRVLKQKACSTQKGKGSRA